MSRLKGKLDSEDNIVIPQELVELEDLSYIPHELELIVDYLIEWKDRAGEDSTWETVASLIHRFPDFISEDVNA